MAIRPERTRRPRTPEGIGVIVISARHSDWPGFLNARSLEGMPTTAGPIRANRLFRSDNPQGDLEPVLAALRRADISTVVDLRSEAELDSQPNLLRDHVRYVSAPFIDPWQEQRRDPGVERSLLDLYCGSLDRNGRTIAIGVGAIADACPGAVLVHCAAGKDRTGLLVAVILLALGTPDEQVIADYATTEARLASYFAKELADLSDAKARDRLASLQHSSPETMRGVVTYLADQGGALAYLRHHGLTDREHVRLRHRLTREVWPE